MSRRDRGGELVTTPSRARMRVATFGHDCSVMSRSAAHQPPPATIVAALMRAGVSWDTAMAMERWKAQEVLELLQGTASSEPARAGATDSSRPSW